MNYFEQELRRVAKACEGLSNPTFAGRACYADLGGDNRVKLQFVTLGTMDKYEALEATILNRIDGEVDRLLFRFSDAWGKRQTPNFSNGIFPHIWKYKDKFEWHSYKPTDADIKQLATEVNAYIGVFTDRSLSPEKSRSKAGEKDSVVKEIRDAKKSSGTRKTSQARKNTEPDL